MSVARFLKQRAVRIQTVGSYILPNWYDPEGRLRSFACRTTRVSPFRALLDVPVVGKVGDRLTSYFREFGKFEGEISDTVHGGFLLELEMTRAERAKLAEKLVWLEKKHKDPTVRDGRADTRYVPNTAHSALTMADGRIMSCFVIDVSMSGVAVSAEIQPEIGTPLAVGSCVGRVVRHFDDGFAVKFVDQLASAHDLERRVIRPPVHPARHRSTAHADEGRTETGEDFFMV
ncbi:PilZ domain-containing protein [Bradyrhizobium ontarionense]|uniref:PilZ domain-containing protein n=1 Tax=Bradyrhizobium ontarionense TaxID=2898149 RepID=A0ABY3RAG3_9BRAD|nr:PilZ domain-containing protein [Bradyrhizobium sp. A19]UFZ04374.1 PilZ domain-containing protein [Bradyrhizobium sp. A19]